jgi:IS30 family transposase
VVFLAQKSLLQKLTPPQADRRAIEARGPRARRYEFVYRLVYEDRKRGGRRLYPSGPVILNRVGIENRPAIVEKRARLGDLKGDLIQGYCASGYILSVVNRKSRLLTLRKLRTKRKRTVLVQLERAVRKMRRARTLTLDSG